MNLIITLDVPESQFRDVLTTACEGASNYWLEAYKPVAEYIGSPSDEGEYNVGNVRLFRMLGDDEFNEPAQFNEIDVQRIHTVVQELLNGKFGKQGDWVRTVVYDSLSDGELGYCDGDASDVIMQLAVFNAVIYG